MSRFTATREQVDQMMAANKINGRPEITRSETRRIIETWLHELAVFGRLLDDDGFALVWLRRTNPEVIPCPLKPSRFRP